MGKQNDKLFKNIELYEQKEKVKQQESKILGQKPVNGEANKRKEEIRDHFLSQEPEVKVIVNGHRYNVSEWFK